MAERHPPVQHYFTAEPAVPTRRRTVTIQLPDQAITLETDRGVFSVAGLDPGTEVLLRGIPAPPAAATVLDLGCGHGVVAITIARRAPGSQVIAVDVNGRALELTRSNAAANGVANLTTCRPEEVDETLRFAAIYSNPPIRVGREPLLELLATWLARLEPDGRAYLVVQRHLGADSLAVLLRGRGFQVARLRSTRGYRLLEVRASAPASHHG